MNTYKQCISSVTEKGKEKRRTRLDDATPAVERAARQYLAAATAGTLHALKDSCFKVPNVDDKDAAKWIYTRGMADQRGPGRSIYDALKYSAEDERCPLCGHRDVSQLDHVMPKSSFPAICVNPLNLVPACGDCNHSKSDYAPSSRETTLLHPYFDDIDGDQWLAARITDPEHPTLKYLVSAPQGWTEELAARVRHHFGVLQLGHLYGVQASRTLASIQHSLKSQLERGGEAMVRDYLLDAAETRLRYRLNGWEGVAYQTWADDPSFCRGSFLN
ncbi:HNH endonuclease [Streptomyces sp. NBC_01006]|uniref:HNH endonuclease n=1 Tax=Streptomyces sp. NBC_01006 TaxID=2903716 RepID=UPI00386380FE|nr:hypothetical protein OG509_42165 [Streptomyces sp. NBC_01006]